MTKSLELKYKLTPRGPALAVSFSSDTAGYKALNELAKSKPDESFVHALEAYWHMFYPNVPEEQLPWRMHDAGEDVTTQLSLTWPLAWYWKSLYLLFGNWTTDCAEKWAVRISQVRDWTLASYLDRRDESLLRPPHFGQSQRMLHWDTYLPLLYWQEEIAEEWKTVSDNFGECPKRRVERAYVLGRSDTEYLVKNIEKSPDGSIYVTVDLTFNLHPYKVEYGDERYPKLPVPHAETTNQNRQVNYPYDMVWMPRARKNSSERDEAIPFLLSSDSICHAIQQLSEVWNDRTSKSILIIAPPGSGKEVLVDLIYSMQEFEGGLYRYALSPTDAVANQRVLFSRPDREAVISEIYAMMKGQLTNESKLEDDPKDGIVFRARRGVLFLDEIDKVEATTRASLLRLLENNEAPLFDTPLALSLSSDAPLFVFAGSLPRDEMFDLKPPDFWTRFTHVIEARHPLSVEDPQDRERIVSSYFRLFWIQHAKKFMSQGGWIRHDAVSMESNALSSEIQDNSIALFYFLLKDEVISYFSDAFCGATCGEDRELTISIRTIRAAVARVLFRFVELMFSDKSYCAYRQWELGLVSNLELTEDGFDVLASTLKGENPISSGGLKQDEMLRRHISELVSSTVNSLSL